MITSIELSVQDRDDLERLHYKVNALMTLIGRVGAKDDLMGEFYDAFQLYEKQKDIVTSKYIPEEYQTEEYTWTADFENCKLEIC